MLQLQDPKMMEVASDLACSFVALRTEIRAVSIFGICFHNMKYVDFSLVSSAPLTWQTLPFGPCASVRKPRQVVGEMVGR